MDTYQQPQQENHGTWVYVFVIVVIAALVFFYIRNGGLGKSSNPSFEQSQEVKDLYSSREQAQKNIQLTEEEKTQIFQENIKVRKEVQSTVSEEERSQALDQLRSSRP